MQLDPVQYWQEVSANYAQMSDGELLELAEKPEDLTEVGQQVLRDEMGKRKLDKRRVVRSLPVPAPRKPVDLVSGKLPYLEDAREECGDVDEEDLPPHEYTWLTCLCDCESNKHALQVSLALKRHGIESWVRAVPPQSADTIGPQVHVAADQFEQAQAILAQPIPQDIIDEVNTEVPEFEMPVCPQCGSKEGAMLESADPVNAWCCADCGAAWTDPEADEDAEGRKFPAS